MNENIKFLLRVAGLFLLAATIVTATTLCIFFDVFVSGAMAAEGYLTETMQNILLLSMVVSYLSLAVKKVELRPAMLLVAGFFACMFIRELDYLFDKTPISWFIVCIVISAACFSYAAKHFSLTVSGLSAFCSSKSFILICTGLICLLIFSRLLGMKVLWQAVLGDNYVRAAKTLTEEGIELFSYTICTIGSLVYAFSVQHVWKHSKALDPAFVGVTGAECHRNA